MAPEIPFDAVTTLLVFLIGVPAIVLQSLPPELRRVVTQRWRRVLAELSLPLLFAVAVTLGGLLVGPTVRPDGRWTWTAVLGIVFGTAIFTAFRFLRGYGRRAAIVARLEREVGRRLERGGRLVEDSLHDLIELGRASDAGREKEWVLESLLNLTERVCAAPDYNGDGLEDLVLGTVDVVLSAPEARNFHNYSTATSVLKRIVMAYETHSDKPERQVDLIHAIRALSKIGRAALVLEDPACALAVVQTLGPTRLPRGQVAISQALFEVGVTAVERGQMLIAISSLERLMTLSEARQPARGDLAADTLGLVAHFWHAGPTARDFALERLERIRPWLDTELDVALAAAADHCARTMQFATADLVRALRESRGQTGAQYDGRREERA